MHPELVEILKAINDHYQQIDQLREQLKNERMPVEVRNLEKGIASFEARIDVLHDYYNVVYTEVSALYA